MTPWRQFDDFFFAGVLDAEAFDVGAFVDLDALPFELLDFDVLAELDALLRFFVVVCLRGRRTGLFQSTA